MLVPPGMPNVMEEDGASKSKIQNTSNINNGEPTIRHAYMKYKKTS